MDAPDGDVILMRTAMDDVRIARPGDTERELLRALDGSSTTDELIARFGADEVTDNLAGMRRLFLIEDAADDASVPSAERQRFDRQLRYFGEIERGGPPAPECQRRLRDASVAVLGVGGLGGRTALELACCGVGELRLIDGDLVEVSNLDRQLQYSEEDLGRRKVDATAARLRAFNSRLRVETEFRRLESKTDVAASIEGADIAIAAVDWPAYEIEFWVNSACFEAGVPYIAMGQLPPLIRVGPLYVPGRTGCFACQDIRYRREYPLYDVGTAHARGKTSPAASLGPPCGVIGGLAGMEVLHFLTGLVEPATLGVGYIFDLRTLEVEREPLVPEPECPVCSSLQHRQNDEP
ncbi:MAG TPA: TOMM precursor leader peptide-binding protein [Solirubrobacterales bacterium]|nr:TOMM precursor leader peptide-binding protein [Solirubrobacterales bacterium]